MHVTRAELFGFFENSKVAVFGAVATVTGVLYGAWWYKNHMKNKPPTNWVKVGEISQLCIYPIKSCKAFTPESFDCTPYGPMLGFMRDRIFAVLNDAGKALTGRNYPKMSQIVCTFDGPEVALSLPGVPTEVRFSLNDVLGEPKSFQVWNATVQGRDCGDEAAKWLSKALLDEGSGLRLFYCADQDKAKTIPSKIYRVAEIIKSQLKKCDGGFYSDAVSYHLISETSTQFVNTRSNGETVSPLNFRPNFVVRGERMVPFEEDHWKWIKIGDVVFRNISNCARCIFTTVNPMTGEKSQNMEPFMSMKRYRSLRDPRKRQVLPGPAMGIYMGVRVPGKVNLGDAVFVPEY